MFIGPPYQLWNAPKIKSTTLRLPIGSYHIQYTLAYLQGPSG